MPNLEEIDIKCISSFIAQTTGEGHVKNMAARVCDEAGLEGPSEEQRDRLGSIATCALVSALTWLADMAVRRTDLRRC